MKKIFSLVAACLVLSLLLCACQDVATYTPATIPSSPTTAPDPTEPTDPPEPPPPEHSDLYIPDLSVEDVITYFNEVCLDAEFVTGDGNASLLQRWETPILYLIEGAYTQEDMDVLNRFCDFLNSIEGFPGISAAENPLASNLSIRFCNGDELVSVMGEDFVGCDGGVTFWYSTVTNNIYRATICIRSDIDQYLRNSVIQEEIYNGMGPVQDTDLRTDSLIYSGFSQPQAPTQIDELLMKLLYHPQMQCGMNAEECEAVIRELYY